MNNSPTTRLLEQLGACLFLVIVAPLLVFRAFVIWSDAPAWVDAVLRRYQIHRLSQLWTVADGRVRLRDWMAGSD